MGDTLRADIERLGLAGKAWLTPYCQDMPKAMNAIDCLVHPQIGTEAFGLVLLEAFACGKPVIASALDGIPEAFEVGNFGQLVQPESVEELGAAMLKWASTPALTAAQKNALHEKVTKDYSVIALAERMQKLYAELLPA
jgi:glycosyltransferase involved in cell wall biosynthesis